MQAPRAALLLAGLGRRLVSSSSSGFAAQALVYDRHGPPAEVLRLQAQDLPALGPDDVLLDILAAPINPSDLNTIEGKYPLQPPLPAVAGTEGVGVVRATGEQVKGLRNGDWVVPLQHGVGTWRQAAVLPAACLHRVPESLPLEAAAGLCINPPTAWVLLETFVFLRKGDTLIQNGANSAVGRYVIQLARLRGVNTVNIVRDRPAPEREKLEAHLQDLGATVVTTEKEAKQALANSGLKPPELGLNCVGGSAALAVAKALKPGGTLVTYGGMSMQPLTLPTSLLIFRDLRARGFWLSGGQLGKDPKAKAHVMDKLAHLFASGSLRPQQTQSFPLAQWKEALDCASQPYRGAKVLLTPESALS